MFRLKLPFHQFNLPHLFSNDKKDVKFAVRINRLSRFAKTLVFVFSVSDPGFRLLNERVFDSVIIIWNVIG